MAKIETADAGQDGYGLRGNPGRVHGSIARQLGIAILSGRHTPGDILPNEIEASGELQVSRSAYREAVRILSAKGLVESRPKVGTRVTPKTKWSLLDPEVLSWLFETDPDIDLVRGLFELRMVVEPAAAAFAAARRNDDQLKRMRDALVRMQLHTLASEYGRLADREFHDLVLEATDNAPLATLSSSIGAAVRWTTDFKQRRMKEPRDPMQDHWMVFDAIAAGQADKAKIAMEHLVAGALQDTQAAATIKA